MPRLDIFLAESGMVKSRSLAQSLIKEGKVLVGGKPCTKPSYNVLAEEVALAEKPKFVGRGGVKLEFALDKFSVDVTGKICLDIGASTGGFTDCLLQRGARRVFAVDVGTSQLAQELLGDKRVVSLEKCDIRTATEAIIPDKCDIAVIDVSFISLELVLPPAMHFLSEQGKIVALIKPQFEVGKKFVGKNGVVRDEKARRAAVEKICAFAEEIGFKCGGAVESPIKGGEGNIEFLMLLERL